MVGLGATNSNPLAQTHGPRSGTAAPGKRNKINMEAYQAYYNTNEASSTNPVQMNKPNAAQSNHSQK